MRRLAGVGQALGRGRARPGWRRAGQRLGRGVRRGGPGRVAPFVLRGGPGPPDSIRGRRQQVRGGGGIDDLIAAYEAAATRTAVASGQIYNIGGGPGETMSVWKEFGPMLQELAGGPIAVTFADWRPGDQFVYISDIRKAEKIRIDFVCNASHAFRTPLPSIKGYVETLKTDFTQ